MIFQDVYLLSKYSNNTKLLLQETLNMLTVMDTVGMLRYPLGLVPSRFI